MLGNVTLCVYIIILEKNGENPSLSVYLVCIAAIPPFRYRYMYIGHSAVQNYKSNTLFIYLGRTSGCTCYASWTVYTVSCMV